MKVKFRSVIGLSLVAVDIGCPSLPRDFPFLGTIAKGLPTRHARAVLFYLREPDADLSRERELELDVV